MAILVVLETGKIILDLCSGTGAWSQPYKDAGYDVRRIELKEGNDVRLFEWTGPVHGILAAPPCDHFAVAGARWWKEKGIDPLLDGLSIVDACIRIIMCSFPRWWALENPSGRLRKYLGSPQLIFDPCEFGDAWTKKTLLWGDFTIPQISAIFPTEGSKIHGKLGGKQKEERSITPPGFAKAFFEANP